MFEALKLVYDNPVGSGILVAAIIGSMGLIYRWIIRRCYRKFEFLVGAWYGHIVMSNKFEMVVHEVNIAYSKNLFRPSSISMREISSAQFVSKGYVRVEDDYVYAYLVGERHSTRDVIIAKCPFNRTDKLDYLNGVIAGVTQKGFACAATILLSRSQLTLPNVRDQLPILCGPIIVDRLPEAVMERIKS